jgi:hypothetical protein
MDLTTALYIEAGIQIFLILFYLATMIMVIFRLSDIRSELRTLNDNSIDK